VAPEIGIGGDAVYVNGGIGISFFPNLFVGKSSSPNAGDLFSYY
jgi:hypothetical protein